MSFIKNKVFWSVVIILFPLALLVGNYGLKVAFSVYNTDLGNGVVIYGDQYVKSGRWVFDCKYSRAISRERLPAPLAELSVLETLTFGQMYYFNGRDVDSAKEAITAITNGTKAFNISILVWAKTARLGATNFLYWRIMRVLHGL
ncbi:hypothetical protein [Pseudomonas sp. Marseille-P9899]|uniref:hypothetical protein n=1 Tax=Pseudomonas sp. Marseille-P9899 TaxID=2730401 RepID=UPI00158C4A07|nr:hypothetical protein [Pseudomonas sp. Marseille-P9899]